ncbi:MAG TPA: diaminopimelate decarboxylase [Chloroflexota bacterium]|jgi:diaminopimelate decarboxylase|nr:diaminopimelate decarboxylase [Chloroflexota bacterium]
MLTVESRPLTAAGHLEIGGCDAVALAAEYGTPLYVLDEGRIRERCRTWRQAFESRYPSVDVEYAGKAFLCLAMARLVDEEGLNLDVASAGELYTALQAGFPPARLVLHGNNKSLLELEMAVGAGVGRIVVDNLAELDLLAGVAATLPAAGRPPQEVLIRVIPGVDPHTHRRIRTGQVDTKFGLSLTSGAALDAVRQAVGTPGLLFTGIHGHVGSNLHDATAHLQALEAMLDFAVAIRDETGLNVEELNLGGGLGVPYLPGESVLPVDRFAAALTEALVEGLAVRHLPQPRLLLEPGRAIVAEAGVTLYTVGAIKDVPVPEAPGTRRYVAVDGGMSDNPRPQLYDAVYTAFLANRAGETPDTEVRIAGKHCETDVLIGSVAVPDPRPGDLLAVPVTGAYTYAMASNYNRLPRPAVVFARDGAARLVVRRETLEDLIRNDA